MPIPSIRLNTGASIPAIGLGAGPNLTAQAGNEQNWLLTGLQLGYKHIDTAQMYMTESAVGEAFRLSGLPRKDVFVTTKLPWHHPRYVVRSFDESLQNLGLDYVDLYLMHFPQTVQYPGASLSLSSSIILRDKWTVAFAGGYERPSTWEGVMKDLTIVDTPTFNDTWAEMERIHATGRARAIGVSNFSIKTLEELLKTAKIVPAVNQVELHPYLAQTELLEYCRRKGIVVTAYSPTGLEKVRNDPTIVALADKYSVSPTQIILAWHLARGVVATPKSADPERQKQNITLPTLTAEDVVIITALDRNERVSMNKIGPDGKLHGWTAEQYGW
ncbi:NADP-dependent oxidoreductase domain-containing protein [Mycena crocata]|nr:NADP-dependent oxidoreductase domain-containing protein [Mycena crocata]